MRWPFFGSNVVGCCFCGLEMSYTMDRPTIHLMHWNEDPLPAPEAPKDKIVTFELEYKGDNCLGRPPTTMGTDPHDSIVYNALGKSRLTASLKFARRTDITEGQAQPVLDEFIAEVRAWFAETFKLEPARTGVS